VLLQEAGVYSGLGIY